MANLALGFWVVLALFLLFFLVIVIIAVVYSFQTPEAFDANFRITDFSVNHKGATKLDALVRNVYKDKARYEKLASLESIRQVMQTVMNSPTFQADHPWESVARDIGEQIWNDYDVIGVSVELLIPSGDSDVSTATFSKGAVTRLVKFDATS